MMNSLRLNIYRLCMAGTALIPSVLHAQNMNAPYSIYGIGDIDHRVYNRTSGMAGTGMAIKSSSDIIDNNPAGIAGLPRSFFLLHLSAVGETLQYAGTGIDPTNRSNKDFWIKGITLASKVNKIWASSIGFHQFSNVNYKFNGTQTVLGDNETFSADYSGEGGLNDFFWTNAFSLGKHFSIGVKSSIIAGGINQDETIVANGAGNTVETTQRDYYGDPRFEYGAIYTTPLNSHWELGLGGKYINDTRLGTEHTLNVTQNTTVIVNNQFQSYDHFHLPTTYSGGISLLHNKTTRFAADYTYENWSALNIKGASWMMVNSSKLSAGIEVSKNTVRFGQPVEKRYLQFGGFFDNSYLQVNGQQLKEFGATAGMGGAITGNLLYSLSAEAGRRGTTNASLIRENFFQFTISISYRDLLLSSKRGKYD